jgi:hypothetical protein
MAHDTLVNGMLGELELPICDLFTKVIDDCHGTRLYLNFPSPARCFRGGLHCEAHRQNDVQAGRLTACWCPAPKSFQGPIGPPDPASHDVDHYKCFTVKVSKGTPRFQLILGVAVTDQFIEAQVPNPPKLFDLQKLTRLCTPVNKNGERQKVDRSGRLPPAANMACSRAEGGPYDSV